MTLRLSSRSDAGLASRGPAELARGRQNGQVKEGPAASITSEPLAKMRIGAVNRRVEEAVRLQSSGPAANEGQLAELIDV